MSAHSGSSTHEREADSRRAFIVRLAEVFAEADVRYVLLHSGIGDDRDSDVDIAVTPGSLLIVDNLVRDGCFGRLLERWHYDVPWCFGYVIQTSRRDRRHRLLDVACDPWGISRYGPSVAICLRRTTVTDEVRVPSPAAEAVYLALKRGRKGLRGPADRSTIQAAVAANAHDVAAILKDELGDGAAALVDDLRDGGTRGTQALGLLERIRRKRALHPLLAALRIRFSAARIFERLLHPTGLVVALVGSDEAGKSELASGLVTASTGIFRRADRRRLAPGLLPQFGRLSVRRTGPVDESNVPINSPWLVSIVRVVYLFDYLVAWNSRVAYTKRRSSLVILERGWFDVANDLRSVPPRVMKLLGRSFPWPDLTLVLDVPTDAALVGESEFDREEIARQLRAWRDSAAASRGLLVVLDASKTASDVLNQALTHIDDTLAVRCRMRLSERVESVHTLRASREAGSGWREAINVSLLTMVKPWAANRRRPSTREPRRSGSDTVS